MSAVNPEVKASIRPARSMGGFVASVVIDEKSEDILEITQHPVQEGAAITDHAYKKPSAVSINMIFEEKDTPLAEIYKKLLKLQADRVPFDVVTGKRIYKNMLLKALSNTTEAGTENILSVACDLQEIITVKIEVITSPVRAARKNQRKAAKTSNTKSSGSKKAAAETPATKRKSALRELFP
jgi:hypothetical protein